MPCTHTGTNVVLKRHRYFSSEPFDRYSVTIITYKKDGKVCTYVYSGNSSLQTSEVQNTL